MGPFINTQTNDYPLYSGDLLLLGITVEELPDYICEVSVNPPEINHLEETYFENAPVLNGNGEWEATFEIRPLTGDEKRFNKVPDKSNPDHRGSTTANSRISVIVRV
jgi:hypothetical protein